MACYFSSDLTNAALSKGLYIASMDVTQGLEIDTSFLKPSSRSVLSNSTLSQRF